MGSINETDAKKRRRTRSGHSQSVSKAHRTSGHGHHQEGARDGMSERLRQGLQLRNKREIGVGPLKGKDQLERLELSQTRGRSEGHSKRAGSPREPRESSGTKDNLLTGGSAEQTALESYLRPWKNHGKIQEHPKTRSHSEDHQERRRRWLQGAKRSLRQRLQPHPEGTRVRHHGQP